MDNKKHQLITATQNWLKTVVIDYNICPFAKHELDRGSIHFETDHSTDLESAVLNLLTEFERLNLDSSIETTLVIYESLFSNFEDYLDFLEHAEAILIDQDYEGTYQLASFHPQYCFEGTSPDDPANYTNRSPYPMLHLLRETSIEWAVANHPNTEDIPQHNIEIMHKLGLRKVQSLLAACYPFIRDI